MIVLTGYRLRPPRPWSSTTWARPVLSEWRAAPAEPWERPKLTGYRRWLEVHDDEMDTAGEWITQKRVAWCWPTLCGRRWTWTVCLDPHTGCGLVDGEVDSLDEAQAAADAALRRQLTAWDASTPEPMPTPSVALHHPPVGLTPAKKTTTTPRATAAPRGREGEQLPLFGVA